MKKLIFIASIAALLTGCSSMESDELMNQIGVGVVEQMDITPLLSLKPMLTIILIICQQVP